MKTSVCFFLGMCQIILVSGVVLSTPAQPTAQQLVTGIANVALPADLPSSEEIWEKPESFIKKIDPLLHPGMTLAFCQEMNQGSVRGPFVPQPLTVDIVSGFETVLKVATLVQDTVWTGAQGDTTIASATTDQSALGIKTSLTRDQIEQITSVEQMLAELSTLDEPVELTLESLYNLLLSNGVIEADITVEAYILKLVELGFLTQEQAQGIFEQLKSQGIFLSEQVSAIFEALRQLNIFISTTTRKLFALLNQLGIALNMESVVFQELLSHITTAMNLTSEEISALLGRLNITVGLSSDKLQEVINRIQHQTKLLKSSYNIEEKTQSLDIQMTLKKARLKLEQDVSKTRCVPGDRLDYAIYYRNTGLNAAQYVLVIQVLPDNITLKKKSMKGGKRTVLQLNNGQTCLVWRIKKKLKPDDWGNPLKYSVIVNTDMANAN